MQFETPANATSGTYYIKGTTTAGYSTIKAVVVTSYPPPVADAGPDIILKYVFDTQLHANTPGLNETGTWSVISGSGSFLDPNAAETTINGLNMGENILQWTVANTVCPEAIDMITVTVRDLVIPTLITPNGDQYNEYFVLNGIETLGRTELIIFDRMGRQMFKDADYKNKWNGIDRNGDPLPDDTYYFTIKSENGNSYSGYIVIRR
jgi:gliding motility-associated-like protein